jgi:NitT/TauT family transport system permease protein
MSWLLHLRGLSGFVLLICLWYLISASGLVSSQSLPSPAQTVKDVLASGADTLLQDILASVRRVVIGLLVGVAIALPVGFIFARVKWISALFSPVVNFARALPPIALIPLVVVYFGIGEGARLIVLIAAAFFPAIVVIFEYIRDLDAIYVRAGQTLGANRLETFYRIILPLSVPGIFTALRVSLAITWATVVAAELIAAKSGLGAYIQNASNFFQIGKIIGGIILIGACALIMDRILQLLQGRILRWRRDPA